MGLKKLRKLYKSHFYCGNYLKWARRKIKGIDWKKELEREKE